MSKISHFSIYICDRCGDVTTDDSCRCATAYDPGAVRRRYRDAVTRARRTDVSIRSTTRGVPQAA